ncbi:MAG: hypothetical protein FWH07_01575 [Oscillospiraceae bacterium]|nr:hypothetical protein [Oscillospiraceae bacterium]
MYTYKHDYKKRYLELFNKVSAAIGMLQSAQTEMENAIIADEHNDETEQEVGFNGN